MATDDRSRPGGRVRLEPETAALLLALLKSARRNVLQARRAAINAEDEEQRRETDAQCALIDRIHGEVERTRVEMGWP